VGSVERLARVEVAVTGLAGVAVTVTVTVTSLVRSDRLADFACENEHQMLVSLDSRVSRQP
jgi:hypothetical protein